MRLTAAHRTLWAECWKLAVLVLIAAGGSFWVYRFLQYMRAVREAKPYGSGAEPAGAGLSEEQLLQLGWMHAAPHIPESSYVRRDILKRPGTTRIGLFGWSFVEGLESGRGYELAAFLGRRFCRAGAGN